MSKMTNCQNDHGGRELNSEPTHTIIWEPYGILQSFVPHSLPFIQWFYFTFHSLVPHSSSFSLFFILIHTHCHSIQLNYIFVARKRDIVVDRKNIQKWSLHAHSRPKCEVMIKTIQYKMVWFKFPVGTLLMWGYKWHFLSVHSLHWYPSPYIYPLWLVHDILEFDSLFNPSPGSRHCR